MFNTMHAFFEYFVAMCFLRTGDVKRDLTWIRIQFRGGTSLSSSHPWVPDPRNGKTHSLSITAAEKTISAAFARVHTRTHTYAHAHARENISQIKNKNGRFPSSSKMQAMVTTTKKRKRKKKRKRLVYSERHERSNFDTSQFETGGHLPQYHAGSKEEVEASRKKIFLFWYDT